MTFSENPVQFNKDLLDALKQAQMDIASSGGVKKVKKGDFQAEYRSFAEIEAAIRNLDKTIFFQENPCMRRCDDIGSCV